MAGDPPKSITLDFDTLVPGPTLEVYQRNAKTLNVTVKNNNSTIDCSGYGSLFYFFQGTNIITVTSSWSTITSGVMTVTMTPTNLATVGTNTYACGVSNAAGITIAQQGKLKIIADPN